MRSTMLQVILRRAGRTAASFADPSGQPGAERLPSSFLFEELAHEGQQVGSAPFCETNLLIGRKLYLAATKA